jgi:hypothetical protein
MKDVSERSSLRSRLGWFALLYLGGVLAVFVLAVRQAALGKPQRGMCFLPHGRDGLYGSRVGAEPDHRLLSRVSAHAIQQSQAAIARLCAALARAS